MTHLGTENTLFCSLVVCTNDRDAKDVDDEEEDEDDEEEEEDVFRFLLNAGSESVSLHMPAVRGGGALALPI